MRESVRAEVLMSFLVSEELSFKIPVELRYETGDPYAVRMTFHLPGDAPVTWAFGRELLLDGINWPSGEGDVRIAPTGPEGLSGVAIRLQVGADRALFGVGAAPLIAFLDRTDRLVPLGQERTLGDFEGSLEEALGRILAEENAG
ncbi:SsgA family sporulation/cell division regulator [Streptomyces lunaelactis]|uniref:SsgA family sporulation/cell division regulator n=1 Tax=Streptomyces lunaelactis TaxID=1535768 RepID=A0A2R4T4H8_9ACTN|nr:SsgA family sporulation/cell division regulator [Streptomyces lunaelactis]AVZ74059.1 SsgA family sporulation/cell division regulator [Streptomyces lunaelactis]NUK04620.1 SsgA family sporulation/cell division regulator [Streptomyces lunaelactis]NUK08066.1 SsgA family sporulation/cell division regulator [Streptomyces lunaelactis]NUK14857.1 SsgA family sporulation/cell division regulator [Streptomyces lunaelactis]NUK23749.1 SsgA family sporulation/cell division regulator [Streptomyces lunaelac